MPNLNHDHNNFQDKIETYLDNNSIKCGCIKKLMIVWVKSCDLERLLTEVANEGDSNRQVQLLDDISISDQTCSPFTLHVFKFTNAETKFERCFLAGYCAYMKCIQTMKTEFNDIASSSVLDQGQLFKKMFDEIMSIKAIQEQFRKFKVSLIYFDDDKGKSQRGRLIDMLDKEIRRSNPVIYLKTRAQISAHFQNETYQPAQQNVTPL
ncbi:uncharacterized protein LOC127836290 [Dreissena polymorpha]|nr:uncharacterized protein LOC127836290 [Dreissena polymorpha]